MGRYRDQQFFRALLKYGVVIWNEAGRNTHYVKGSVIPDSFRAEFGRLIEPFFLFAFVFEARGIVVRHAITVLSFFRAVDQKVRPCVHVARLARGKGVSQNHYVRSHFLDAAFAMSEIVSLTVFA